MQNVVRIVQNCRKILLRIQKIQFLKILIFFGIFSFLVGKIARLLVNSKFAFSLWIEKRSKKIKILRLKNENNAQSNGLRNFVVIIMQKN